MRRILLASVAIFAMSAAAKPHHSYAIIMECANCATIVQELKDAEVQGQQLAAEVAQKEIMLNQYAAMIRAGLTLPQSIYAEVRSDIMQIRNIANAASLLTGNSGSIISRLSSAQGYASQAVSLGTNIGAQFTMWQQTLGNASNALGRTLGVQQGQENNYTALQAAIQAHSSSAAGQMQAIQAGNELAALTSTQLNQIQTTLTAAAQQQATENLVSDERRAIEDAYTVQFFSAPNLPTAGPRYQ